ncbi:MAG: hypothetical protein N2A42_04510 [Luteolibacter sp.]
MKALLLFLATLAPLAASPYGISGSAGKEHGDETFGVLRPPAPPQDDATWSDFVTTATTAKKDVTHWDALDSFNLGPRRQNSPFRYVELLTLARKAAPQASIGFSLANYDLEFLDDALREGAGGQFDYISLSPFPCSEGCGFVLASVLPTLRKLLATHGTDSEIPVHITLSGGEAALAEAAPLALALGFTQIFLETDPATLAKLPTEPASIPTSPDLSGNDTVRVTLGETNKSDGLHQVLPSDTPWDEKLEANRLHLTANPPVFRTTFLTAPGFVSPGNSEIEITVTAKRIPSEGGQENPTGFNLTYESTYGTNSPKIWWGVAGDNKWHTHTWTLADAKFTGKLGWNFLLDASGAGNDVLIKEVSVKR